jgi:hypothetical protein
LEGGLEGVSAVGEGFTMVDPFLWFLEMGKLFLGLNIRIRYPKFAALMGNLGERKSVKEVLKVEGVKRIFLWFEVWRFMGTSVDRSVCFGNSLARACFHCQKYS